MIEPPERKLVSADNPLVALAKGDTMYIGAGDRGYRLTRRKDIAEQRNSSVWQADHSGMPDQIIVVKIIKTTGSKERDAIQATEAWIHEKEVHSSLGDHVCTVIISILVPDLTPALVGHTSHARL